MTGTIEILDIYIHVIVCECEVQLKKNELFRRDFIDLKQSFILYILNVFNHPYLYP